MKKLRHSSRIRTIVLQKKKGAFQKKMKVLPIIYLFILQKNEIFEDIAQALAYAKSHFLFDTTREEKSMTQSLIAKACISLKLRWPTCDRFQLFKIKARTPDARQANIPVHHTN